MRHSRSANMIAAAGSGFNKPAPDGDPMETYVALGTNYGELQQNLRTGLAGLGKLGLAPLEVSSVWETEPVGTSYPRWFLNMVVLVRTELAPLQLLDRLLELESRSGRVRDQPNAPRTLDLDLLMMGDLRLEEPRLTLPHPRMWERRFVLEPLAEIAPGLRNPLTGRSVLEECGRIRHRSQVRKLGELAPARDVLL